MNGYVLYNNTYDFNVHTSNILPIVFFKNSTNSKNELVSKCTNSIIPFNCNCFSLSLFMERFSELKNGRSVSSKVLIKKSNI